MKSQELHLIHVFDAIMTERSITRAADRLAMTQPAVSNVVSRMRHHWGDPLFIRKGRNIEPTSYAISLWHQIKDPIYELNKAISTTEFDPSTSKRRFRVAVTEVTVGLIWAELTEQLNKLAPGVDLHAVPYRSDSTYEDLKESNIDIAIGFLTEHDRSLRSTLLVQGGLRLAMRKGHPLAKINISMDEFIEAEHLMVSLSGEARGQIDTHLNQHNLSRRIAVTVNHFAVVPKILLNSDLICAVPIVLSNSSDFNNDLFFTELPFEIEPMYIYSIWHARNDRGKDIIWFRNIIEEILTRLWSSASSNSSTNL